VTSFGPEAFSRERFACANAAPEQAAHECSVLRLLLAQEGSTTHLCETVAGGPVQMRVLRQRHTGEVPAIVREQLPGERFIERITFLAAHGAVLMDNLSYIALHGLENDIERDLLGGTTPIGHLLARWWVRRETVPDLHGELAARLWQMVGLPDAAATRSYRILTPEGPRMLIAETYRRGLWMQRPDQ
jgi:chorismate-pyruvate lyase